MTDGVKQSIDEGAAWCRNAGGKLVVPKNHEENKMLVKVSNIIGSQPFIGVTDRRTESVFEDLDGNRITFLNWHKTEPNNHGGDEDCIGVHKHDGSWYDVACTIVHLIVCELA